VDLIAELEPVARRPGVEVVWFDHHPEAGSPDGVVRSEDGALTTTLVGILAERELAVTPLEATVLDLPPSAAVGRKIVAEEGFADRVSFREGDVFELGLGEDLDVVSVFNLIHHLPEERDVELCRMARAALRPGGVLVIGDSARPEPGDQLSPHGAVSSLLFYAWSHSRNFAPSEVSRWMREAGFEDVEVHRNVRSLWRMVVTGR